MTTITCGLTDCLYNERMTCKCDNISIDDDGTCGDYHDYTAGPEYQHKFYRAKHIDSDQGIPEGSYKEADKGKKLTIDGITVYYTADDREGLDGITCTEEITATYLPHDRLRTEDGLELIKALIPKRPKVADLQEVAKEHDGRYSICV